MTEEGAAAPPAPPAEEEAHETLLGAFRQRALALLRAERALRLYTGIAIAELLVCTILVLAGDLPLPRMGITSGGNSLDTIPIPISRNRSGCPAHWSRRSAPWFARDGRPEIVKNR